MNNSSQEDGSMGTLKEIVYANNAKARYTYDSLDRLDVLSKRTAGGETMKGFDYTYDDLAGFRRDHLP